MLGTYAVRTDAVSDVARTRCNWSDEGIAY